MVGDIGEDGGAAGRDAVLREKQEQAGKEVIDRFDGCEFGEIGSEDGGDIAGYADVLGQFAVARAEKGIGVGQRQSAACAVGETVATARRIIGGTRVSRFCFHFGSSIGR